MLWASATTQAQTVPVVADLSIDVLWPHHQPPVVLERTISPLEVPVEDASTFVGVRFAPSVCRVALDPDWDGWSGPQVTAQQRLVLLELALSAGAIRTESDPRLDRILDLLNRPTAKVRTVAHEMGASPRQLLRWTTSTTGLTPKQLYRHLRIRRFWESDSRLSLIPRAVHAGFFDQSHASNEIRTLTGLSASRLAAIRMADSSKTST